MKITKQYKAMILEALRYQKLTSTLLNKKEVDDLITKLNKFDTWKNDVSKSNPALCIESGVIHSNVLHIVVGYEEGEEYPFICGNGGRRANLELVSSDYVESMIMG